MIEKHDGFRKDINGLRAWAVIAVIGFHFGISGFSGGFAGVDIFFVLSGYLMAGIVIGGAERIGTSAAAAGRFLASFYLARARRILPALICLCGVLMLVGWFTLSATEYERLAKHAVGALVFLSNIRFSRENGYFDVSAQEKVLLHTWSLSLEWQFYLLFPILVLVSLRLSGSRRRLVAILALLALASLGLSILTSAATPSKAFFQLPWRAWELLAGSLLWCLGTPIWRHENLRKGVEAIGFALIVGAILFFNDKIVWPGWSALVPVIGTGLVLVAGRQDSALTALPVAQWLGRSSYSLYLWHWPIVVALYYLGLEADTVAILVGLGLTLLMGWLSYRWIETPARIRLSRKSSNIELGALVAALVAVAGPSQIIKMRDGIPGRLSPEVEAILKESDDKNPRMGECHVDGDRPVPECTYGGPRLGAIVIGDSHAAAIARAVEKALPSTDLHVLDWTMSACRTIDGRKKVDGSAYPCGDFVRYALDRNKALPDAPLIIMNRNDRDMSPADEAGSSDVPDIYFRSPRSKRDAAFFDEVGDAILATACEFARTRPVYYVRPIPEMDVDVPKAMGRSRILGGDRSVSITLAAYHKRHAFIWRVQDLAAERCGVKILDPLPYLCTDGLCHGASDGVPNYYDDDHLSLHGADRLIPMFRKVFEGQGPAGASS